MLDALNADTVTIAVTAGTSSAETAAEKFPLATITEYETHDEAAPALRNGVAMAFIGSTPLPKLLVEGSPDTLTIAGDTPLRTTVEGFAVPLGESTFLTFLDNWIDAIAAEGFIDAARQHWYETASPPVANDRPAP